MIHFKNSIINILVIALGLWSGILLYDYVKGLFQ